MGIAMGSLALVTFELTNELLIGIGSGILGLGVVLENALKNNHFFKTLLISSITVSSFVYFLKSNKIVSVSSNMIVFITGCDSGLGFSLAQHACEMGFTVLAGCLNLNSNGAGKLRQLFGTKIHLVEIDVTSAESVRVALEVVDRFLSADRNYRLWAVINNAGVMVFGEFEWLTDKLMQSHLDVNLMGTFRVTKAFCPLLRHHKGRLVVISSHCALSTLPGLSVYGATKSGLMGWCDGLRVELGKHGVKVVSFVPGSFFDQSNIMARQVEYSYEMHSAFTPEQHDFYGDYFKRYNSYLSVLSGSKVVKKIENLEMYEEFEHALLDESPKTVYKTEPFRYWFYHFIFKYSPTRVRDYFVTKFMCLPKFQDSAPNAIDVA